MSQFYDQASLVMVPSGYKNGKVYSQKPLSTDGELTFSRASNATRVNSSGLVEKVRTNLVLQSNTFSTTWGITEATLTSGQSGYDGTNNAWKITANTNNAAHYIVQSFTLSGQLTLSLYAKSSGYNFIMLYAGGYGGRIFDISNGTLGSTIGTAPTSSKIEAAGNGYYRCSINVPSAADMGIFVADSSSTYVFAGNGTDGVLIQAAQVEYGDIATDYIATTSSAVSVGPVSGLPRLDYSGGATCPSLLLEPQRTNVVKYSEQLNVANWGKSTGVSTADNEVTSPDGYTNADKVTIDAGGADYLYQTISGLSSGDVTFSCWAKANTPQTIGFNDGNYNPNSINLTTEWQRFTFTFNYTGGGIGFQFDNYFGVSPQGEAKEFYVWGMQAEQASYATSYIPTLSTSVTRVAEAAFKTSATALIGQTEGTIYWEVQKDAIPSNSRFQLSDGTADNWLFVSVEEASLAIRIYAGVLSGTTVDVTSVATLNNNAHKIAFAYATNDFKVYVDGVEFLTHTSGNIPACSRLEIGNNSPTGAVLATSNTSQALLFKTRLTNAQLAELTA